MPIIRRLNCIDAASGIVTLSKWPSGAKVEREEHLRLLASCLQSYMSYILSTCAQDGHSLRVTIPDAASIQFIFLMMSI